MTTEEMQQQINSMMPTPRQIVEHLDKEVETRKQAVVDKNKEAYMLGYKDAVEKACRWLDDNICDYYDTDYLSDFEILKEQRFGTMIEDLAKYMEG